MRWIPYVILLYLVVQLQTTLSRLVSFTFGPGEIGPDLAVVVAVFVAMQVRGGVEVYLACWSAGLAVDLASGGGPGIGTVVGPMSLTFTIAGWMVYRLRETVFRQSMITQAMLGFVFALVAHGLWVTLQAIVAPRSIGWSDYWSVMLQMLLVALYTAVVTPLGHKLLERISRWFVSPPMGRERRSRY